MYLGFGLGLVRDLRFEFDLQFDLSIYFDPRTSLTFLDHQKLVELVKYFVLFNKPLYRAWLPTPLTSDAGLMSP